MWRIAVGWLLILGGSCTLLANIMWNGLLAQDRTFEQLLDDAKGDVNREAAIEVLRQKLKTGVQVLLESKERTDRAGMLARNALEQIAEEAQK